MKIEFLYKDDTYKTIIENLKESLGLEEKEIVYTPVVQAGLNIFSFQKNGENEETAKVLDEIKKIVLESLSLDNLFIITDEISSYFCQRLYPQLASFERGLRKVLYIASLKSNDENIINLCKKIEELEFAKIYQMLFSDTDYITEAKKIVNSNSPSYSKHDILKQLANISESTVWDKLFKGEYSYIPENFLDIKAGRNKVMHSRNISYAEFSIIKNTLSKSNKLLRDMESDLLEKENNKYQGAVDIIISALSQLGKAMHDMAVNRITTTVLEQLGELAYEGIFGDKASEKTDVSFDDIVIEIDDKDDNADEEGKELCLTN